MESTARALLFSAFFVSTLVSSSFVHLQNNSSASCDLGQVSVEGQCLSIAKPGSPCTVSQQCIAESSKCMSNLCSCSNSLAQIINSYCLIPSSACPATQTFIENQCVYYSIPGSNCYNSKQCLGGSTCVSQMCACPEGKAYFEGYCVPTGNQTNSTGCPTGKVPFNGQCISKVGLGQQCDNDIQCPANATCYQETCQCSTGLPIQNGNCVSSGSHADCPLGQASVGGRCLPLVAPGTQCQSSLQCVDKSECANQQCTCIDRSARVINGYCLVPGLGCPQTQTRVNERCLTFARPGAQCEFDEQCVSGSECKNKMCTCPLGTKEMYGYCISSATPTNPCQSGQELVNGMCAHKSSFGGH